MFSKKEFEMATSTYQALTEQEKRQVSMYGVTEAGMRQAVESSITFKFSGPAMVAASLLSDAQEMMAYEQPDFNTIEDQRQLINRAKWILFEYMVDKQNG
jgi:predicted nucleic acid-binding protein